MIVAEIRNLKVSYLHVKKYIFVNHFKQKYLTLNYAFFIIPFCVVWLVGVFVSGC